MERTWRFDLRQIIYGIIILLLINFTCAQNSSNPLMNLGGGLSESLSAVLDCNANGKAGLCVPTVLKDVVCLPLGFHAAPDNNVCGADNICCYSNVDSKPTTKGAAATSTLTTTTSSTSSSQSQKGSASILLLTATKPEQTAASQTSSGDSTSDSDSSDSISNLPVKSGSSNSDSDSKPRPFKVPASLSAFIPDLDAATQSSADDDSDSTTQLSRPTKAKKPGKPNKDNIPIKFCRVGGQQGMCVKSGLIQSLCLPLGFATSPQGCSSGYLCCFTPSSDDSNVVKTTSSDHGEKAPINKPPDIPIPTLKVTATKNGNLKVQPLDSPSRMDTCVAPSGQAGLCIRTDIASMVCTPLGYSIGERMTCSYDRVCCYLDKTIPPQDSPNPGPFVPTGFPGFNNRQPPKPCQLGPEVNGICVPANLISSCPLFGRKVSAFGCATRHLALPNYCCYEDKKGSDKSAVNGDEDSGQNAAGDDISPMQPYVAVAGAETVPKLDSLVCGRKGLTGIEPRALARRAKLLGSHPTLPGEICWHASLFDTTGDPFCNGALVHRNWVLTAAHCVKRTPPSKTIVKLGLWSLNNSTGGSSSIPSEMLPRVQTFRVLEAFIHYSYDAITLDNDVALLHLDSAADFAEPQVCLVCLPSQEDYTGAQCSISSFSSPDGQNFAKDSILSQLEMNVINSTTCQTQLSATGKLQNSFRLNPDVTLCAAPNPTEDTCKGDGGSSFACQNGDGIYELAGMVSWGLSCGLGAPTVFTRVWLYNSWIQEIIRRYS